MGSAISRDEEECDIDVSQITKDTDMPKATIIILHKRFLNLDSDGKGYLTRDDIYRAIKEIHLLTN